MNRYPEDCLFWSSREMTLNTASKKYIMSIFYNSIYGHSNSEKELNVY